MSICAALRARTKAPLPSGFYMTGSLAKFMGTCTFPLGHLHDFSACVCTGDPIQFNQLSGLGPVSSCPLPVMGHTEGASLGRASIHGAFTLSLCPQESGCTWVQAWPDQILLFFTTILQRFCLLLVGSPTNKDLTLQCTRPG